jgi:hypothetical protein
LVVRVLARLLVLPGTDEATNDLEIPVLQQQLGILRRQAGWPRFTTLESCSPPPAATSCQASGPTATSANPAGHQSTPSSSRWGYGWPGTTLAGLRADLRGAAQARHPGGRHHHQDAAATTRPRPAATTLGTDLGAVPQSAGRGDRGVRSGASIGFLLHDHDAMFTRSVDDVFSSEGGQVLRTRSGRRRRTPMPSAGCRPCGRSACTSITRSQHDESRFPRPTTSGSGTCGEPALCAVATVRPASPSSTTKQCRQPHLPIEPRRAHASPL